LQLYERATDATLTHEAIEAEVNRIDREFDGEGLKAVARKFGISSGLSSKGAAKTKILNRIAERKGRHERGEVTGELAKPPSPESAAAVVEDVAAVVVEEEPPTNVREPVEHRLKH